MRHAANLDQCLFRFGLHPMGLEPPSREQLRTSGVCRRCSDESRGTARWRQGEAGARSGAGCFQRLVSTQLLSQRRLRSLQLLWLGDKLPPTFNAKKTQLSGSGTWQDLVSIESHAGFSRHVQWRKWYDSTDQPWNFGIPWMFTTWSPKWLDRVI